jgi:FAD/FMN-containing dehydrogenase
MTCTRAPGTGVQVPNRPFVNWAKNVTANPQRIYQPTTVAELVAIVKEAEANNVSVRAFGSGWSFTEVMVTPGYMVNTDQLKARLSETMTGAAYPNDPVFAALTPAARKRRLCHVEAGIKLHDLHDQLENDFKSPVPGVILNDGPGGAQQPHGYAVTTLGGSGGQSIAGAASTSTHGGDDHDALGAPIRPLPDMVHGIHLVGPGGAEYFIQRGGPRAIVNTGLLAQQMPCVAGRIISNDDAFNAAVVSVGRMGIIYSVVIEVREQYVLLENVAQDTWNNVSSGSTIANLRARNRFLQVLILPYANQDGDHTCFVTTRNEVQPVGPPTPAGGFDPFTFACELRPEALAAVVAGIIAALAAVIVLLLAIPFIGEVLAAADILLVALLTPLLDPSVTIGDYLAGVVNILTKTGRFDLASQLVNTILSSALKPHQRQDLGYKIMDTYDYNANCFKALSIEVAFDADGAAYLGYIRTVFGLIDVFAAQNILVGAYISLRYCAGSSALLAIEQWPHTVCIEISALGGLDNEVDVLNAFEQEAANRGAAIHWGQMNMRSRADIESVFASKIDSWRTTLGRIGATGKLSTFDNDFCINRGLEVFDTRPPRRPDLSYLDPLLLRT